MWGECAELDRVEVSGKGPESWTAGMGGEWKCGLGGRVRRRE